MLRHTKGGTPYLQLMKESLKAEEIFQQVRADALNSEDLREGLNRSEEMGAVWGPKSRLQETRGEEDMPTAGAGGEKKEAERNGLGLLQKLQVTEARSVIGGTTSRLRSRKP